MNLLESFKNYLFSQDVEPSRVTVKNYLSDVNHFVKWFEKQYGTFLSSPITNTVLDEYRTEFDKILSPVSMQRHLSSLRKFFKYLKSEGKMTMDPFAQSTIHADKNKDLWRLNDFKNNLFVANAAHLTIKNYIIDVKQFVRWAKEVTGIEDNLLINRLNTEFVEEYKQRLVKDEAYSPATVNRKLSSLRKYLTWAQNEGLLTQNLSSIENINEAKEKLYIPSADSLDQIQLGSIENIKEYSKFPPLRLVQKFSGLGVLSFDALFTAPLVKIATKAQEMVWKIKGQPIFEKGPQTLVTKNITAHDLLGIKNISKQLYAPFKLSIDNYSPLQKLIFHTRYTRPNWYKTYHSYAITHYFHFAVLVIFLAAIGFGIYNSFFIKPSNQNPALAALPTAPPRILSFQGRLTDENDNPITANTNIRFAIYDDLSASGGALLWQEVNQVLPDTDGIFNSILGNNTTIPSTLFSENSALYLGVTIETTPELTPRQQLATVAYAANSETLQGLVPITGVGAGTNNVVLALDSSGNLTIGGSANPVFTASGGQFKLSGQPLLLTTNVGTDANVQITTDDLGKLDFQKPILNSTNNNNIQTAQGAVEVNDLFAILATSSGQSAFTINQTSTGPIISASSGGTARFTVDNSGNTTIGGDLAISGGNVTTAVTFDSTLTANGTLDANGIITLGDNGENITLDSSIWDITAAGIGSGFTGFSSSGSITFSGLTSNQNSVLYAGSGGAIATANNTTGNLCLVSDAGGADTPGWASCNSSGLDLFWKQSAGALFPNNSTADFLVGGQATTSAKFAVLNTNSGTPVASVSSGLNGYGSYLTADGTLGTTRRQSLIIGNSSTYNTTGNVLINSNGQGNVGIGTAAPAGKLDVWGAVADAPTTGELVVNNHAVTIGALNNVTNVVFNVQNRIDIDVFKVDTATNGHIIMTPQGTGNVGIGTTNPTALLDVAGTASVGGQLTFRSGTAQIQSTARQTLSLGGNTTGLINVLNSAGSAFTTFDTVNSRVGIGTSVPLTSLHVGAGALSSSFIDGSGGGGGTTPQILNSQTSGVASIGVSINDGTRNARVNLFLNDTDGVWGLGQTYGASANYPFVLISGAVERMRIDSSGNASMSGSLTLAGGVRSIQTTANNTLTIGGNTTGNIRLLPLNGAGTVSGLGELILDDITDLTNYITGPVSRSIVIRTGDVNDTSDEIGFEVDTNTGAGTTYTRLMTLDPTGNVGIGDSTPASLFTVGSGDLFQVNSSGAIAAATGLTSSGSITFSSLTSNQNSVLYAGSGGAIATASNTIGNLCLVSDAGGADTPGWASCTSSGLDLFWKQNAGALFPNNSTVDFLIGGQSTASAKFAFTGLSSLTNQTQASISGQLIVMPNNGYSGKVGIGTTSPGSTLPNGFTAGTIAEITSAGTSYDAGLFLRRSDQAVGLDLYSRSAAGGVYIDSRWNSDTTGNIYFRTKTTSTPVNAMTILGSGNVGIGTTTPTALLDVAGTASVGGQLTFRSGTAQIQSTARQTLSLGGNTTGLINILDSAGTTFTTFDTVNSRVGIGTTGPAEKLEVNGNIRVSTGNYESNKYVYLGPGTTNGIGQTFSSPNYYTDVLFGAGIGGNNSAFRVMNGSTEIMRINASNNVGINNAIPLTALDVTGSASLSANLSLRGAATAHTFNILDNGTLNIQRSPGGDAGLATALFIQSGGNVGIGTTTPGSLLQLSTSDTFRVYVNQAADATDRWYYLGGISTNNGEFIVNGIMAGHADAQGKASVDVKFSFRDGFKALGNVWGEIGTGSNIEVFNDGVSTYRVYLRSDQWGLTNINLKAADGAVVTYDGTYTTTNPSGAYGAAVFSLATSASQIVRLSNTGNLGIGDISPDAKLEVLSTTEQLRLTHTDGTVDTRFTVGSDGNLTIDASTDGTGSETLALTGFTTLAANGALSVGTGGTLTLGDGGDAVTIDSNALTLQTTGAGSDITINAVDQIIFSDFITDANSVLYTTTTGSLAHVVETETGSQCLLSGAGASGIPTWGSCVSGITADSLDFDDFVDSMTVDAATDINLGANALSIDLDSTGDFSIRDVTTDIATFADSGAITFAPTSGQSLAINLGGAGDFVVNTDDLYVDTSTGFVGIGTTNPLATLDVRNATILRLGIGTGTFTNTPTLQTDASDTLALYAVNNGANITDYRYYIEDDSTDSLSFFGNSCAVSCNSLSSSSVIMTLKGGGNVGIGTTGPATTLDVNGITTIRGRLSMVGSISDGTGSERYIGGGGSSHLSFNVPTGSAYYFGINNATKMIMDTNGNVGIGTTGPDQKLDVLAGGGSTQLRLTSTDGSVYTDFKTDQIGDLTITPSGGDASISGTLDVSGTSAFGGDAKVSATNIIGVGHGYTGTSAVYGVNAGVYQYTTSNANSVTGVHGGGQTYEIGAGNTLAWARGVAGSAGNAGGTNPGTVTNAAALYALANYKVAGTLTTGYGLYVEDQTAAASDYGIYVAGADTYALYVAADDAVFLDDLFVGAISESIADAGFVLNGDDAYIEGDLGINGTTYLDGNIDTLFTGNNAVVFGTVTTGVLSSATTSTANQCLLSGAGATYTPTWGSCVTGITADSLDFDDFVDSMTVDAATDINLGANALSIDLDSTGDFSIRDVTTDIATFADSGAITFAPTSGQSLAINLGGAGDFVVNTDDLYVDTSTGFVGIGTTNPGELLELSKANGAGNVALRFIHVGQVEYKIGINDSDDKLYITNNNGASALGSNSTGIVMTSTGLVGIGTAAPSALLDVNGTASVGASLNFHAPTGSDYGYTTNHGALSAFGSFGGGRIINRNTDFISNDTTGYNIYNNLGNGSVSITNIASSSGVPNSSARVMKVTYNGSPSTASPGYGGFYIGFTDCGTGTAANAYSCYREGTRVMHKIWAKIPTGYNLQFASNPYGTGSSFNWITSQAGTGQWEEYIAIQYIGTAGTFSSTGFYYVDTGPNVGINWFVANTEIRALDEALAVDRAPSLNVGYKTGTNVGWGEIYSTGKLTTDATGNAINLAGAGANIAFTGAGVAQISTASSQNLALMPGGTGVGIGTTGPNTTLELSGATAPKFSMSDTGLATGLTTYAATNAFFQVEQVTNDAGGARIWGLSSTVGQNPLRLIGAFGNTDPTDTVPGIWLIAGKRSGTALANLGALETVLQVSQSDGTTHLMTVLGSGNVGIGTTTPTAKFQVGTGAASDPTVYIDQSSGTFPRIWMGGTDASVATVFNRTQSGATIYFGESADAGGYSFRGTGTHTIQGNIDANGAGTNDIAGTLNLSGNTLTSTGDLTITPATGNILSSSPLNIGGATQQAYNFFADSTATNANAVGDNDLYIEDDLEVDGSIFGTLVGSIDTTFTQGSVVFAGAAGVLAEDNASLFFDDTNNRLGVGRAALSGGAGNTLIEGKLQIQDTIPLYINGNGAAGYAGLKFEIGASNASGGNDYYDITMRPSYSAGVATGDDVTAIRFVNTYPHTYPDIALAPSGGNVGIGDASPDAKLEVLGTTEQLRLTYTDGTVDSRFTVASNGNLTIDNTGTMTTIADDLDVAGGDITSANQITSDVDVSLPRLVLDSSSAGDNWTAQGAYISIGESGALGSASMHLTYTGDGYGYSGAGTVTTGIPAGGYWRYLYNAQNIYTPAAVQINGTLTGVAGNFSGALTSTTLDTGQGANELYDMNQNVQTTDSPTFAGLTMNGRINLNGNGFHVSTKDDLTTRTDSGFWQTSTATTTEAWPETTNGWYHLITSTHSNDGNYYSFQIASDFYTQDSLFFRATNGSGATAWSEIWTSSSDGSGSGLDADTVDTYNPSATAGTASRIVLADGSGYITNTYFHTTADVTAGTATHFAIQTSSDNFIRWQTPANARTSLGLGAGGAGDIWVEKAGDTMTGALTNTLASGNSLVWDTSTLIVDATNNRVGVGTTTPKAALTVVGGGTFANNHNNYDSDTTREGLNINSYDLGQPNTWQRVSDIVAGQGNTASEIRFLTADWWTYSPVARMVIRPSGFVGIGAATPSGKLHVVSDNAYNDGGGLRLQSNTSGTGNLLFASTSNAGDYAAVQSYKDTIGAKPLLLNGMGGVVIAGGFNSTTGLGSGARFQVHGPAATDTAIGIWQNGVFSGKLGSLASDNNFYISNTSADGVMSAAHGITITSGYNVGVGAAPLTKLHVQSATDTELRVDSTSSTNDPILRLTDANGPTAEGLKLWYDSSVGDVYFDSMYNAAAGDIHFRTKTAGTPVDALFIESAGNVGIGTTAPLGKLSVGTGGIADGNLPIQISAAAAGETYFAANKASGYGAIFGFSNGAGLGTKAIVRVVTADPLSFYVNSTTEAMTILSTGLVGIGMTPTEKLSVNGKIQAYDSIRSNFTATSVATARQLWAGEGSINNGYGLSAGYWLDGGVTWRASIQAWGGGAGMDLSINPSGGNVGIGTTAPVVRLEVQNTGGAPAASGTTSTGLLRISPSATNSVMDIGTHTGSPFYGWIQQTDRTNLAATYPLALQPNGGNVGIGTTAPAAKLTVTGGLQEINVTTAAGAEVLDWPYAGLSIRRIDDYTSMTMLQFGHRDDSTYQTANAVWNFRLADNTGSKVTSDANTNLVLAGPGDLYLSPGGSEVYINSNVAWHAGNDGSGSGLDADLLDGANLSASAGNSTVVQRNGSGYVYANYFNTTADVTAAAASHFAIQTSTDSFIRWQTPANARTSLGLTAGGGGDIWVEKAGDTMTGGLVVDTPEDYDATVVTSLTSAPIQVPQVNIGTTPSFLPFLNQNAQYSSGYVTHMSLGLYKGIGGWGTGDNGFYVALGGNDSYPTEYFKMTYGGNIVHSGAIGLAAGGTNQNVVLTPSGTGYTLLNGNVGIGTTGPGYALAVNGVIHGQATANSGDVLRIGNDSKLVDIDVANTAGIYGLSDTTIGSLKLGSAGPTLAGTSGLLSITGGLAISGTLDPNGAVTLPTTGISGAGAGSGLNADLLDNYNLDFASTVSTVVGRDGSGDINVRLVRSEYDSTNATIGYIMTQIDTVSNNYIRPSTPAQLVTGLGLEAGGSRDIWVEKAGDNMTGGLNIYNVTSGGSLGIAKQGDATYYMQLGMDTNYIQYLANNAYWNGTQYNYVQTGGYGGLASAMRQVSGEISFNTASGGTNPITWSQRMTIQNDGDVGIGTSTPTYKLEVGASGRSFGTSWAVVSTVGDLTNNAPWYGLGANNVTLPGGLANYTVQLAGYYGIQFKTGGTDMVITNAGNVGIGDTSPTNKLDVTGAIGISDTTIIDASRNIVNSGNITFTGANPTVTASSYIHFPGGAYFNGSTVYAEATIQARGGIADDGGNLTLADNVDISANSNLTMLSGTGAYTQTFTGTTTDAMTITAQSLTSGSALEIVGATSGTALTSGLLKLSGYVGDINTAGGLINSSATFATTAASSDSINLYLNTSNAPGTNANTAYGIYNNFTDATALANTVYGQYNKTTLSGNANKSAFGLYNDLSSSSTTGESAVYGFYNKSTITGAMASGTQNWFGDYTNISSTANSSGGSQALFGNWVNASSTLGSTGVGSTINTVVYGSYITTTATYDNNCGTNCQTNQYGLWIADGTSSTNGDTWKTLLVVASPTGADNNQAAWFQGGEVQIDGYLNISSWSIDQGGACGGTARLCFEYSGGSEVSFTTGGQGRFTNGAVTDTPDIAENISVLDQSIESGDIVTSVIYDSTEENVYRKSIASKSDKAYQGEIIGAISENPGFLAAQGNLDELSDDRAWGDDEKPLTVAGRIPVKVSTINGDIKTGDSITSSEIPGIGMKATKPGVTLGIAMADYEANKATQSSKLVNGQWQIQNTTCQVNEQDCYNFEKILVFISPSWRDPDVYLTSTGNLMLNNLTPSLGLNQPNSFTLTGPFGLPIERIGAFAEIAVAQIRAGIINSQQIFTNSLSVATDNVTIAGQSLYSYISAIVSEQLENVGNFNSNNITSPIASIDTLKTGFISPIGEDSKVGIKVNNDKIEIVSGNSATNSAVASFDNKGNATLSGTLTSAGLSVSDDASISGTLRVRRIIADQIEGLDVKAATIAANYITNVTNVYNSSSSAFPTIGASGSGQVQYAFDNGSYINIASFSSQLAYVENLSSVNGVFSQNLTAFGTTTLSDTSIVGQLAIGGSLILANNSVNVLGNDLNLQPLRQGGISIMAGLIYIDTNGNVKIGNDVTIEGTLYAKEISPISGNDLTFKLSSNSAATNKIAVKGASNSAVLAIDNLGNIIASGAGSFAKLNINSIVGQAFAISPTEVTATGSAGTAKINAGRVEMTINNNLVTDKSLIYITPTSNTQNQVLYLLRQVPSKSFTVGIQTPTTADIPFNWIIVN